MAAAFHRLPLAPVRGWRAVPRSLLALLVAALLGQLAWHALTPPPGVRVDELPPPPPSELLGALALGEDRTAASLAALWLQFHDTQPGYSVPFRELDYTRVRQWLERILALAPERDYPLLLAVRIYGQVNDPPRQRIMLGFVREAFVERPRDRWRWLAEAIIIAKHRLHDLDLALEYARLLNRHTQPGEVPFWARDLQLIVLEEMGELEATRLLIGGMLESGEIDDPQELRFLDRRLKMLENRASSPD